jgi:hypothetical protein
MTTFGFAQPLVIPPGGITGLGPGGNIFGPYPRVRCCARGSWDRPSVAASPQPPPCCVHSFPTACRQPGSRERWGAKWATLSGPKAGARRGTPQSDQPLSFHPLLARARTSPLVSTSLASRATRRSTVSARAAAESVGLGRSSWPAAVAPGRAPPAANVCVRALDEQNALPRDPCAPPPLPPARVDIVPARQLAAQGVAVWQWLQFHVLGRPSAA